MLHICARYSRCFSKTISHISLTPNAMNSLQKPCEIPKIGLNSETISNLETLYKNSFFSGKKPYATETLCLKIKENISDCSYDDLLEYTIWYNTKIKVFRVFEDLEDVL